MRSFIFALVVLSPLVVSAGEYNVLKRIQNVLRPAQGEQGLEGCTEFCHFLTAGNCQHPNIDDDICVPEIDFDGSGRCHPGLILCNGTKVLRPPARKIAPFKDVNCVARQCMTENGMVDVEGNMDTVCMHNSPHNLECRGFMPGTEICPNGFIDCQQFRVSATPTRTRSTTKSPTRTASSTRTASTSSTRTASSSRTATASTSASSSRTATSSVTASRTATSSASASVSPSDSSSSSVTMSRTVSPSSSATRTSTPSESVEPSLTPQPSESVSAIPSSSPEPSITPAPSPEALEQIVEQPTFNGKRICMGDEGKDKDKNARLYCNSVGSPNYISYTIEHRRMQCCRARETNNLAHDCEDTEPEIIKDITCQ